VLSLWKFKKIYVRGVGLIEVPCSMRVEKQIADIEEKSDKKKMEVSRCM
jgi:hypothetical protein